jgi:flagellar hook-basal body complex protein FliE
MTTPISAISGIGALGSVGSVTGPAQASATSASSGADFASALAHGIDAVNASQATADSFAVQAATGTLTDPAQYTIAATQAQLMTQLATTIENKAVTAFNQIMGMQA